MITYNLIDGGYTLLNDEGVVFKHQPYDSNSGLPYTLENAKIAAEAEIRLMSPVIEGHTGAV